jgi:hypothetical protein
MAKLTRLEPAATILSIIGIGVASRITRVHRTNVWRWTQPKWNKGTGGLIPQDHHGPLLDYAEANDLPITPDMFIRRGSKLRSQRESVVRR